MLALYSGIGLPRQKRSTRCVAVRSSKATPDSDTSRHPSSSSSSMPSGNIVVDDSPVETDAMPDGLPKVHVKPWEWLSKAGMDESFRQDVEHEYCNVVEQPKETVQGVIDRLTAAARECVAPSATAYPFGSTVNGFGTVSSDLDVLIGVEEHDLYYYMSYVSWYHREQKWARKRATRRVGVADWPRVTTVRGRKAKSLAIEQLEHCLPDHGFRVMQALPSARKPLLTCADTETALTEIDVSINNRLPLHNSKLLKAYSELDHRVRPLVLMVKAWSKARGVCGAGQSNLSSYSWTIMSIYFMQLAGMLPSLQKMVTDIFMIKDNDYWGDWREFDVMFMPAQEYKDKYGKQGVAEETQELTVAELFYGFVYFFDQVYEWGKEKVSMRAPDRQEVNIYFRRFGSYEHHIDPLIHVEDPIEWRDLNVVLQRPDRLVALKEEFHRARQLLERGASLAELTEKVDQAPEPWQPTGRQLPPLPS